MKNSATNLRALLGVTAKSTPVVKVSPSKQAEIDERAEWLKTGQLERLAKIENRRYLSHHFDLESSPTGRLPLGRDYDEILIDALSIKATSKPRGSFAQMMKPAVAQTSKVSMNHLNYAALEARAITATLKPPRLSAEVTDKLFTAFNTKDYGHCKIEPMDAFNQLLILKGRQPGLMGTVVAGSGKPLSDYLNGVSLNKLFENAVKSIRLANIYDANSELLYSLVSNIRGIYHIANAPDGNPVLAEHIANWWEENKETYSLPATI